MTITPQGPETTRIYIRLFGALNNLPRDNVVLQPNDYLFIRTVPDWDIYKTVQIAGEVKSPGPLSIKKGEMLSSVLARAGGFTDKAYLLGAVLIRESTPSITKATVARGYQPPGNAGVSNGREKAEKFWMQRKQKYSSRLKAAANAHHRLEKGGTAGKGGNRTGGSRTSPGDSQ